MLVKILYLNWKQKFLNSIFFSITIDEWTDIYGLAQLLIFIQGIDLNLNFSDELVEIYSSKGTTMVEELFIKIVKTFKHFV